MICELCRLGLDMCECRPFTRSAKEGPERKTYDAGSLVASFKWDPVPDDRQRQHAEAPIPPLSPIEIPPFKPSGRVQRYEVSSLREMRMIEGIPGEEHTIDTSHPDYCGLCHSYHSEPLICELPSYIGKEPAPESPRR